jgi:hypothetical protein
LVSRKPHTVPLAQSESLVHTVPPPSRDGHFPTTHEHFPAETGSQAIGRGPLPAQYATGGGGPQSQAPASGAGAHTAHTSQPLASFCGITPYMQFGRLQIGAGGHASTNEPPSGGGAQIGHVGHPFASVAVAVDPYSQGTQGKSLAAHASDGQAGKPQAQWPFCSSQTLSLTAVPSGQSFARAGAARPAHDACVHTKPPLPPSVDALASSLPPEPTGMGPPASHPLPSAPIKSGRTSTIGTDHATRERSASDFMRTSPKTKSSVSDC